MAAATANAPAFDWQSLLIAIGGAAGGVLTGAGAFWLKLRSSAQQDKGADRQEDRSTREELLGLLNRLQDNQLSWMKERAALHDENLTMRSQLAELKDECAKLSEAVATLKDRMADQDALEAIYWSEHFDAAPVPILRVSAEGKVEDCNEAFEEAFGYPKSQVTDLRWQDITHPEDLEADLVMVEECLRGKRDRYTMQKRYRKRLEEDSWVKLTLHVVAIRRRGKFRYFNSFVTPIGEEPALIGDIMS